MSQKINTRYARLFSIGEIEASPLLQWFFGAMLFFFFETFSRWISESTITVGTALHSTAVCWPYFQDCYKWYFLHNLPYGYTQTELYMAFYGVMLVIVWCMWRKSWVVAHALMMLLLVWKLFVLFVLSYTIAGPYDYYHVILTMVFLFTPFKEYFLKVTFALLYFMSVTIKFDPTWTLGTYFTAMKPGMPLFPEITTVFMTNLVIFMQIVGCWYLLSRNWLLQRLSLAYFTFFHLYSGILVGYTYPSIAVIPLLILFGPMYRKSETPVSRKAIAGWLMIALIVLFQLVGFLISPERRLTLEGNRFGMFMFEANHQCIITARTYYFVKVPTSGDFSHVPGTPCSGFYCLVEQSTQTGATSSVQTERYESGTAWNRCDPYEWYTKLNQRCASRPSIERIALTLDHSIDGGPFYRIVDVPNICDLTYNPFAHNAWILSPPEAPIIGYPVQNWYHY